MGKKVIIKIRNLAKENDITLRQLSRITDIRHAALSELVNQKRQNINFRHIERIAESLGVDDIREIIDLENTKE